MKHVYWKAFFGGALVSVLMSFVLNLLLLVLPKVDTTTMEVVEETVSFAGGNSGYYFLLFIIIVVSPVLEEIFFRGLLWNLMSKFMRAEIVYVIVSLLFMLAHVDPLHIIGLAPISFLMGWFKYKTGNVKASIVCHASNNLFACLMMM